MTQQEIFSKLSLLNVNDKTEKKNDLTYLSWAWAWQEFKKVCPTATYEIDRADGTFVYGNAELGYMVRTAVTVTADDGVLTHEMWLPVMDYKNKTLLQPTMFDVNKAIMRCLTKNLAMFGLGVYIYAGEDLPERPIATQQQIEEIKSLGVNVPNVLKKFGVAKLEELTEDEAQFVIDTKKHLMEKQQ